MPVIETAENDVKERLSIGMVTWVAARAGCQLTSVDVDRDSVDITIRPVKGEPVCIDAQLKSSSSLKRDDGHLVIDLPLKNYDDLRADVVGNARILIVLDLHDDTTRWISTDQERFIGERLAYWLDLFGAPPAAGTTRKRVKIPLDQTFTPQSLRAMMQRRFDNIQASVGGVV